MDDDRAASRVIEEEAHDGVAWLTLNRPQALNALSAQMLDELDALMTRLAAEPEVRVLVITGSGRAFCAGADLSALSAQEPGASVLSFLKRVERTFARLRAFPKPVIAAINGVTAGGGLELALCTDFILAVEGASISDGHANVGAIPGGGASAMLPRLLGPSYAKYLMFSGEAVKAEQLVPMGLVAKVFPAAAFEASVRTLALRIAGNSPAGLAAIKRLVAAGLEQPSLGAAIVEESREIARYLAGEDFAEGVQAFLERRTPKFSNGGGEVRE